MTKRYKLLGYISPLSSSAGFITPVFEKDSILYAQKINDAHKVTGFEKIHIDKLDIYDDMCDDYVGIGDYAIYSTQDRKLKISSGDVNYMKRYFKQNLHDYIDSPFFYRSISDFCQYTLPEYSGCITNKHYLFRKVISNLVPAFNKHNDVKLKKIENPSNKFNVYFQGSNSNDVTILESKHKNLSSLYKNFLLTAIEKNHRIKEEKTVRETLELDISSEILPYWINEKTTDYRTIRSYLVTLLDEKYKNQEAKKLCDTYHIVPSKPKTPHGNFLYNKEELEWVSSFNSKKISYENLSFVIFVTSLISKSAREDLDK
ncbi:hypothetical protein [Pseudoalteromonas sp. EB27]|uniref:hypothetical protein n=1 Tax=Pseudoalteromonas sp. EB27 TaxID=1938368 RepID=UPI000978C31F|nr:hypothetical protein [Pseudoalteromonas sp. EB27]